jgi:hypothetical protein
MAPIVQNATDLDEVSLNAVVDGKGEPAHQGATKRPVHRAAGQWHPGDVAERAMRLSCGALTKNDSFP